MGLDMYLTGIKHPRRYYDEDKANDKIEGFEIASIHVRLGYWRKHANLHGYMVDTFAEGEDNCQPITLCRADIEKAIEAIEKGNLPHTEGFFFRYEGYNSAKEKASDLEKFRNALKWIDDCPKDHGDGYTPEFRYVIYEASW